jgi:RNA polymerase sigma-70 factor, ECF subfamily
MYIDDISSKELTDIEVINMCLNKDVNYFNEILIKMGIEKHEIEDLAQEIFIKVYKNLNKYSGEFKFSTWIMKISSNHVIDHKRKKHINYINMDKINELEDVGISPQEVLEIRSNKIFLIEIINKLPEIYKVPIVLYHSEGLSYKEISDKINEPLSKVKNRIFRGRKILKDNIIKAKEQKKYEL